MHIKKLSFFWPTLYLSYACIFADNNNDSKLLGRPMASASLSYDSKLQPTYAASLPSTVSLHSVAIPLSAYRIILNLAISNECSVSEILPAGVGKSEMVGKANVAKLSGNEILPILCIVFLSLVSSRSP